MIVKSDYLRDLVKFYGIETPKRHGFYYTFAFENENTKLVLDSWNGALSYKTPEQTMYYFGMAYSWGGKNREKQPENVVNYYIEKVNKEIDRKRGLTK